MEHLSKETISAIEEFLKSGETFAEIARRTRVSEEAVKALWRRLKKETAVSENNPIKTISDLEKKQADFPDYLADRKSSCVRFKADLLIMLNLSANQLQALTGYSHAAVKSIRKKLRELEYLNLFDKSKKKISVSTLQYRIIESLYLAFYFRAVGLENKHEINLSAFILAFLEVERILHLPEFRCLQAEDSRLMLKDLLQSLQEIRENLRFINVCPVCGSAYAVQASSKQNVNNDCPFCLFNKKYQKESNLKTRKTARKAFRSAKKPAVRQAAADRTPDGTERGADMTHCVQDSDRPTNS